MAVTHPATTPTTTRSTSRGWWSLVLAGGLLGIVGTIWQTVERLDSAVTGQESVCDISSVISCGGVYQHWQASALGVPNALIGLPVFAFATSAAVAALLGSSLSARYLATLLGLSTFMTAFVFWYMEQTAFAIGALCLFCTASMFNILFTAVGLTRIVDAEQALGEGRLGRFVHELVDAGADLLLWFGVAATVGVMLFVGLVL